MVRNSRFLIFFLFFFFSYASSIAQVDRYMVFFHDKVGSQFSLDQPAEFLSPRALERREKFNLNLTADDLPISQVYIQEISNRNIPVYYATKWFNGVLVEMNAAQAEALGQEEFVKEIEWVAPGAKLGQNMVNQQRKEQKIISSLEKIGSKFRTQQTESGNSVQWKMLGVENMHLAGYRGEDIWIAVMDGGFFGVNDHNAFAHLFENQKILGTKNYVSNNEQVFVSSTHGTRVLSCMAANNPELLGTAPEAHYLLCMTEDVGSEYRIEEYNWLFAAEYADSLGIDVINTSLGYTTFDLSSQNYSYQMRDGQTAVITRATNKAYQTGMLLVTSAGNDGNRSGEQRHISTPADSPFTLSIGAVNSEGVRAGFSSVGPTADGRMKPEFVAMGQSTAVTGTNQNTITSSGTSFAAPLFAGLVAGMLQAFPDKSREELIELIKEASSQFNHPDNLLGFGLPDVSRYFDVQAALEKGNPIGLYPNPVASGIFYLEMLNEAVLGEFDLRIVDINGKEISFQSSAKYFSELERKVEINIGNVPTGVYLIQFLQNGNLKTFRFAKN